MYADIVYDPITLLSWSISSSNYRTDWISSVGNHVSICDCAAEDLKMTLCKSSELSFCASPYFMVPPRSFFLSQGNWWAPSGFPLLVPWPGNVLQSDNRFFFYLSLRDHCPPLPDGQCFENHCFINFVCVWRNSVITFWPEVKTYRYLPI